MSGGAAQQGLPARQAILIGSLSAMIMMIDGYDIGAMPILVPRIAELWQTSPASFGMVLSAVVIGLGVGAFLLAPLGDRLGRRMTTVGSLLVVSLATIGTTTAESVTSLFWWRLITGIGLGACLPNVLAILAQIVTADRRASVMTVAACGIPLGAAGAGWVVPWLTRGTDWQAAFFGPGLLMLGVTGLVAIALRAMPEAPAAPKAEGGQARIWEIPVLAPLRKGLRLRTAIFSGLFCCNSLAMYMLASWLPTLLGRTGFSFETASGMASLVQLGGLFGGLALAFQFDKQRTTGALLFGYGVVMAGLTALAFLPAAQLSWSVILLLVGCGIAGAHIALPAVAANIFPTEMLSAAIGLAVTIARIGAMMGPMLGAWLVGAEVSARGFFLVALIPVAFCVLGVLAFARSGLARARNGTIG